MPSQAGDAKHYELVNPVTKEVELLPRVTSIIGRTLNKPHLITWAENFARDAIFFAFKELTPVQRLEVLEDVDDFHQWLKDQGLTVRDYTKVRQTEGKEAHATLEALGEADEVDALRMAQRILGDPDSYTGYEYASARWWMDTKPKVLMSEALLVSWKHRYAGTVDLIWQDERGNHIITDLKSRRADLGMYESDDIQTGAYSIAYKEMDGLVWKASNIRRTVLLVHPDGTYKHADTKLDEEAFLDLRSLYRKMTGE
jgi:hypothetical protein